MADILVIDDEESIRYSFHRFLTMENHSVITAACYYSALSQMSKKNFDLILADIHLPDGWGIDILHEVTRNNLTTPVIIMTAYPCNESISTSFTLDAVDYLIKPLRQKTLVNSVNNALMHILNVRHFSS
nr:response regulator [uncultured Desulfobulbus sp.]